MLKITSKQAETWIFFPLSAFDILGFNQRKKQVYLSWGNITYWTKLQHLKCCPSNALQIIMSKVPKITCCCASELLLTCYQMQWLKFSNKWKVSELSASIVRPGGLSWNFVTFLKSKLIFVPSVCGMWLQEGKNVCGASFSGVRRINTGEERTLMCPQHGPSQLLSVFFCMCGGEG